jgi:putative transposase
VDSGYMDLSVAKPSRLLRISRSTYYYESGQDNENRDLEDLKLILDVTRALPFYGNRKVTRQLIEEHPHTTRKRVRRIMRRFGVRALYAKPRLMLARKEHKKCLYLLIGKVMRHPNHT